MKNFILVIVGIICTIAIVVLVISDQKENYYSKVSTSEAEDIIKNSDGNELIYFYKKGCAACNSFKPILNAKIKEDNIQVYAIDVEAKDSEGRFLDENNINSTPTIIKFTNGKAVGRHEGSMTKNELEEFINN
ncbi:thioredoxin family protein [Listeria seeligeri]|uniref:thioredoxin family protein n=1 Tax=Listeria seeligeri TaxID=1640 RepID=UPI001624328F|nr:thioredoxin family protein [Listeria seeligeri]MBC1885313.1 thioredoxin family protein [Listeria seeligeri]MBC1933422.1 thioredoxin family protein [Listeria seeligeri]